RRARHRASAGVPRGGFRSGVGARAVGRRSATGRGRHGRNRPFPGSLSGASGRRREQCMNSPLAKLAQPLRRGEVEDLRGLTIDEPLALEGVALPNLDFSGTTFNAPVALRGAVFGGLAWFIDCTFNAAADFSTATFLNDGRFDRVRFRRVATF